VKHKLTLEISAAEMKRRKAKWKKPAPRYRRGVLAKFGALATSASTGAVTDAGL
jgi:dihydroxy-acid dehydratase